MSRNVKKRWLPAATSSQGANSQSYTAFIEELPGANTQSATLDEALAHLEETVRLILDANRQLAEEAIGDAPVIRVRLRVSAA